MTLGPPSMSTYNTGLLIERNGLLAGTMLRDNGKLLYTTMFIRCFLVKDQDRRKYSGKEPFPGFTGL